MRIGLNTFKHLLPSGKAWRLTVDRKLRQFFQGLSVEPGNIQDYQDGVWNDVRPATTTKIPEWEDQFGLLVSLPTEQERRDRLSAEWQALGGQSPRYLQDIVQAAGFPLFIHEWWESNVLVVSTQLNRTGIQLGSPTAQLGKSDPIGFATRNPFNFISPDGTGFVPISQLGKPGIQLGNPLSQLGNSRSLGILLIDNLPKPITWPDTNEDNWPFFLYFGAEEFGETVDIPASRFEELKTLLLKLCPAQQWIGVLVELT